MTNLTEKWKSSKLKEGFYYIELIPEFQDQSAVGFCTGCYFELFADSDIKQVLAPVPSYEKLEELKIDNHNLKAWIKHFQPKYKEMEKENDKLKELLKECSPYVSRSATSRMIKNSVGHKKDMKLLTEIDEVLK